MKRIRNVLIVFLIAVCFFVFGNKVLAYEPCGPGDAAYCSGSTRWYCNGSMYVSQTCTYGCTDGVCNAAPTVTPTPRPSCSGSGGSCMPIGECRANNGGYTITGTDCPGSEVCCRDPVNGSCGSANNASALPLPYSAWNPSTSALCSSGGVSWSGMDQGGTDGDYNWRCYGTYGGVDRTCSAATDVCAFRGGACTWSTCSALATANPTYKYYTITDNTKSCGTASPMNCCMPSTCKFFYGDNATCKTRAYCPEEYSQDVIPPSDCTDPNYVCCTYSQQIECNYGEVGADSYCQTLYSDSCMKCNSLYQCARSVSPGSSGVVGSANGTSMCSISAATVGLCDSSYGVTITDNVGSDGTFNWTCEGQSSSTCRTAGSDAYGTATKIPVVSGDCGISTGSCNTGTAVGVGVTQAVSGGINNLWSCGGTCGGGTENCTSTYCINAAKVNGACKSNITGTTASDLCFTGTPVFDNRDANHDYINDSNESEYVWGCEGSNNTCNEGDGTDQLACISIIDQNPWFRVNNGSIITNTKVTNYVPATCTSNNCATVVNGGVYANNISKSGFDKSATSFEGSLNTKLYYYDQLKLQYFTNKGVGTTFGADNREWSTMSNTTGVLFVDGDLNINQNLATSNFVMIIAKGNITIDPTVNRVDGILVANTIIATGDSNTKLVINGVVHGANKVEFSRNLIPQSANNTSPSIEVNYKPELLFMVPQPLVKALNQWKVY